MGITKQYLRWEQGATWGLVSTGTGVTGSGAGGSSSSQAVDFLELDSTKGRFIATSACENVIIWDSKTSEKRLVLSPPASGSDRMATPAEVTCLTSFTDSSSKTFLLAAGRHDGSIDVYNYLNGDLMVTFHGHRTAVNCLAFDRTGMRLVSGGKDCEIVIWDVLNECGLFRLKGHKGPITCVSFMKEVGHENFIISSSKDMLVKFWDVTTQHCYNTIVGHRSEVWSLALTDSDRKLITGASDSELKVWTIHFVEEDSEFRNQNGQTADELAEVSEDQENESGSPIVVSKLGVLMRSSTSRTSAIRIDSSHRFLIVHGTDSLIEVFRIRTEEEAVATAKKRAKRELKRLKRTGAGDEPDHSSQETLPVEVTLQDRFENWTNLQTDSKIKGAQVVFIHDKGRKGQKSLLRVAASLGSNAVQTFGLHTLNKELEYEKSAISSPGHKSDVRCVALSSDNVHILTMSADSLRVWNRSSGRGVISITEGVRYPLDCIFVPGERYALSATKNGFIQIFDLIGTCLLTDVQVSKTNHPVWSLASYHTNKGVISGCEDKLVKFYDYELIQWDHFQEADGGESEDVMGPPARPTPPTSDSSSTRRVLGLVHKRTLQLDEGVLCVRVTPNGKHIAVALLDSTVKIFFADTLNFFLSLYGHKLPVLSMDISSDSTLIATGSSDKNIKLWGLDFGDCHKSIFAHTESIMAVKFQPKTHYLFTASKDKTIRQWDCDKFEKILELRGHHAEIWAMAISSNGKFIVSASRDKSLRLWNRAEEILVIDEERELEREHEQDQRALATEDEAVLPDHRDRETGLAQKKTTQTLHSSEKLMEATDVFKEEYTFLKSIGAIGTDDGKSYEQSKAYKSHKPNPLLAVYGTGHCPFRYMLETLRRISSTQIEEAILTLPFSYIIDLVHILPQLLERKWDVELLCRYATFIIRIHFSQISSTSSLIRPIGKLRTLMADRLKEYKMVVGQNMGALEYYMVEYGSRREVTLFADAAERLKDSKSSKKKRRKPKNSMHEPPQALLMSL